MACMASSSLSKTLAVVVLARISADTALCFTTAPSGAILPRKIAIPPCLEYGLSTVCMTSVSRILILFSVMYC